MFTNTIEPITFISIQFFADAGTVVNVTSGTVNAYTGQANATEAMSATLKDFYDTELLENARVEMIYAQFGMKQALPAGHRGTVEWRKFNTFARAEELKEGVIPDGQTFGMTKLTGSIKQYGTYTAVSDVLKLRAYDDIIGGATVEMGASAAETQEVLIRDALLENTNVLYCDNINTETGAKIGATPTTCAEMTAAGGDAGMAVLTPTMVNKAVTIMKKNRVPKIGGKYVAVIHPSVALDLRESKGWIEAHKYSATTELFNGEIGELHGCRFVENVFAPVLGEDGDGYTNKEGGRTYATYMFGADSFGIIDPAGGALRMIIHNEREAGGPLEQFSTVGYKFETNGATMLYPERLLRIMSVSSSSAIDEVN